MEFTLRWGGDTVRPVKKKKSQTTLAGEAVG